MPVLKRPAIKPDSLASPKPRVSRKRGLDLDDDDDNSAIVVEAGMTKATMKQIMDKAWSEISEAEQTLASLPKPTSQQWRQFHADVAHNTELIPAEYKAEYDRVMALKGSKGVSVGRTAARQSLCKQWIYASTNATDGDTWGHGAIVHSYTSSLTLSNTREVEGGPWDIMCGRHVSEEAARTTLQEGELQEYGNEDSHGPRQRGTGYSQISAYCHV